MAPKQGEVSSALAAKVLEEVCERRGIPGAVLGVMADGQVVARATYGSASLRTGVAVTDDTLFQAGSIGKAYTATVIMSLVDEGKLDLDAPVRSYLDELVLSDRRATETVTTRQLLCHMSDIDGDSIDTEGKYGRGDDCLQRYVADLESLPMIASPGTLWSYCNSGYILLGRLIEVLAGTTYEQALAKRLFEPMGLERTFFFPEDVMVHAFAVGHLPQEPGKAPMVSPRWAFSRAAHPAGGNITTSTDELLAFGRLHLEGGMAANGTRILSEESTLAMQEPVAVCPEPELLGDHWGLGWFLHTRRGPVVVGHDGNTIGQTAGLRLVPEHNVALAMLTNLSGQNRAFSEVTRELLDPWLGTHTPAKAVATGQAPAHDRLVGTYEKFGARIVVQARDGVLHAGLQSTDTTDDEQGGRLRPLQATDEADTLLMHLEEIGEDMAITFMLPDGAGHPQFAHMGARAYPRVSGSGS
ncbi:MAG TPA: serine hydrolase domain-containing protein [Acidimicrobiales bacterium]|nr:serine hydrolase domain-containing protein [Acidimicrobiales bacterium]